MDEQMLERIPTLKDLPIFEADSDEARALAERSVCELAEACDAVRVHDILHRSEYKPLAAVRDAGQIRVYFEIRNHTGAVCN